LVILVLVLFCLYGSSAVEIITKSYKDEPAHWTCDGVWVHTRTCKATRNRSILHIALRSARVFLEEAKIKELLNKYNKFVPVCNWFWNKKRKIEQKRENLFPEDKEETYKTVGEQYQQPKSSLNHYQLNYQMKTIKKLTWCILCSLKEPLFHIHLNIDYPF
jgi:molecular chaperone HtpG